MAFAFSSLWLPRMRGDRPEKWFPAIAEIRATPHARGSTFKVDDPEFCAGGYPACAGIDPGSTSGFASLVRLPRMRGDRPSRKKEGSIR